MQRSTIPFTGLLTHCYDFLVSPSSDIFIQNSHFNPDTINPITIFCVHGTADRAGAFSRVAMALMPTLGEDVRGFYLASFEGRLDGLSIEAFSRQLREKINNFGDRNIILMGHSRGALVGSWYAETMAPIDDVHVDTVVAICGPFKGTRKAIKLLAWFSRSVEQMRQDSDFLPGLRKKICDSSNRYLFVGAKRDFIVEDTSWHPYTEIPQNANLLESHIDAHLSITSSHLLAGWLQILLHQQYRRHAPRFLEP